MQPESIPTHLGFERLGPPFGSGRFFHGYYPHLLLPAVVRHLRRLRPVRLADAATTIPPSADRLSTRVRNAGWLVLAKGDRR